MMPSRGLRLAGGNAPRLFQLQCRNLSSASRRIPAPAPPFRTTLSSRPRPSPRQWQSALPAIGLPAYTARHASSTADQVNTAPPPSSFPQPPNTVLPDDAASSAFPNMDTITLDNIDAATGHPIDPSSTAEYIGYLHDIGLNYGYGPTSLLQWSFEHFHISAGLPWWGAIAATAIVMRIALIPFFIKSSDSIARSQAVVSLTKPIMARMEAARRAGDNTAAAMAWQEQRAVMKRAGVRYRDQFVPIIFQGVFGYCGFKLLRAAAYLPVPGFQNGGFGWLQDLTVSDPYLLLPAIMAGTIHLVIRLGGESGGGTNLSAGMQKFMLYGMPSIIFISCGWLPGAVVVWFAAGGMLSVTQSLLLQRPAVREFLGIAPLFKPQKKDAGDAFNPFAMFSKRKTETTTPPPAARKNASFMNTSYQSPNLRGNDRVIDVQASSRTTQARIFKEDPATGEEVKEGNVFDRARSAYQKLTGSAKEQYTERFGAEAKAKEQEKQAAAQYEKRAREKEAARGRRGRR